jgi:GNAT superfamily N-acetyltransferase
MKIENSTKEDIEEIFRLYKVATDFQKLKFSVHWPSFERSLVEAEITEHRQWKMIIDNKIVCVWATTFSDPQIWEERDDTPSVYIHRIARDPEFQKHKLVGKIIEWAKDYAFVNHKKYIRMDTVGDNPGLINYYTKCGFDFLGLSSLKNTAGLPAHYNKAIVCLFQMEVNKKA